MARLRGLEPLTPGLEGRCSIRLSYRRIQTLFIGSLLNGRGRGIRTPDPLLPKQMRYQTALFPENHSCISSLNRTCDDTHTTLLRQF